MAYEGNLEIIPGLAAGADLSSSQFRMVKINASGLAVAAGAGEKAVGVLQDAPDASGKDASVAFKGVTKMEAGAAVTAGDYIMSDATGRGITGTATNFLNAVALSSAGAAGELFTALIEKRDIAA